jgi:hypothetical protein
MDQAAKWIERHRRFWTRRLDALEAMLRAEDAVNTAKKPSRSRSRSNQ